MQNYSPTRFLSDLDFNDPTDLFIAFHALRHWPTLRQMEPDAGMRELGVIQTFHPLIFGQPDNDQTIQAVEDFIWELGGSRPGNASGSSAPLAPREWLCVFREAFDRGDIGPVALGAAVGLLMVCTEGNGAAGLPADSIAARRHIMETVRRASPFGIMDEHERRILAGLPPTVTLWRGGSLAPGETLSARAQGLHWALGREYALTYMRGRNAERTLIAMKQARTPLWDALGRPFLLKVEAPKDALLAYKAAGADRSMVEVFVDFERLPMDKIQDVTPAAYRWAA